MIQIKKSQTADTRTCDFTKVTKETLLASSVQHINDVKKGFGYLIDLMNTSAQNHDSDKLTDINGFHSDFVTGFKNTTWWDNHRKITRHHLLQKDGIPEDVNLIDVLDMIIDCVMAGMGRSGSVYPLEIDVRVLIKAFDNTADLLKKQIIVESN